MFPSVKKYRVISQGMYSQEKSHSASHYFLLKIDQKKYEGHNAYDYLIVGTIAIVI